MKTLVSLTAALLLATAAAAAPTPPASATLMSALTVSISSRAIRGTLMVSSADASSKLPWRRGSTTLMVV